MTSKETKIKVNRKFCNTAKVPKDLHLQLPISSKSSKLRSKSKSESKFNLKRVITKRIQVSSSNYKQHHFFAHIQGHVINNLEIERKTISKSNEDNSTHEDPDDRLESKQIMVPFGEYLSGK